jgi:hypothetical protein
VGEENWLSRKTAAVSAGAKEQESQHHIRRKHIRSTFKPRGKFFAVSRTVYAFVSVLGLLFKITLALNVLSDVELWTLSRLA